MREGNVRTGRSFGAALRKRAEAEDGWLEEDVKNDKPLRQARVEKLTLSKKKNSFTGAPNESDALLSDQT